MMELAGSESAALKKFRGCVVTFECNAGKHRSPACAHALGCDVLNFGKGCTKIDARVYATTYDAESVYESFQFASGAGGAAGLRTGAESE